MDAKYLSQFIANLPAVQFAQSVVGSLPIGGQAADLSKLSLTKVAASSRAAGGNSGQAPSPPLLRRSSGSSVTPTDQQKAAASANGAGNMAKQPSSAPVAGRKVSVPRSVNPTRPQKAANTPNRPTGADAGESNFSIKSLRLKGFKNEKPLGSESKVDEEAKDVIDLARSLGLKGFVPPASDK